MEVVYKRVAGKNLPIDDSRVLETIHRPLFEVYVSRNPTLKSSKRP
jgi:hypothetical protein